MKCPSCGFDNIETARFCGICGISLSRICPRCNTANPFTYRFCMNCGSRLTVESQVPAYPSIMGKPAGLFSPIEVQANGIQDQRLVEADRQSAEIAPTIPIGLPARASERRDKNHIAPPAIRPLVGERRIATVIMADVKNSTKLMEKIGTEAWVEIMDHVFQILETEIYRFGGVVDQFRGDGLVAFFGARTAAENDPEHAVLAGLMMQEALGRYATDLAAQRKIDLRLRIGINTGEIIVASVGDRSQHMEDTAMGGAVAMAARLETACEAGTVMVSESTYRMVADRFHWKELGEISLKGISQPVPVYRPLEQVAEGEIIENFEWHWRSIPLTGRQEEFNLLKNNVEGLLNGRGSIVLVSGDKGMGKSFIVNQVRQHFVRQGKVVYDAVECDWSDCEGDAPQSSITWLRGRSRSFEQSWPYAMWVDLLQQWVGSHAEEDDIQRRIRLRHYSEILWGKTFDQYYPYLASFLSLPLEKEFVEKVQHLDAEALLGQFTAAIRSWIEAVAHRGPLVLNFADVQWADASSLRLLENCLPISDSEPVLFLVVFRAERTAPVWELRHHIETHYPHRMVSISLPPFSLDESNQFIDQLLGAGAVSPETRQLVLEKSEGNPYYIQELLHTLIAHGVLVRDTQTNLFNEVRPITSLDLPDSLQSLLIGRIDRLSPDEKRVLQMAAVIGTQFWRNPLQALAGDSIPLRTHLTSLQRAELILERSLIPDLGMEYIFNSSLVRDVAYESLLNTQRVGYHLKLAEYLENIIDSQGQKRLFSLIAYHFRQAGQSNKEFFYTLSAAERARDVYANVEGLQYYNRAIELLDQLEASSTDEDQRYAIATQRFEVINGRAEIQFRMGDIPSGNRDAQILLKLARQMPEDPTWLIDALLLQPEVNNIENKEQLKNGIPIAQEALNLAQKIGDTRREMRALLAIASQHLLMQDPTWQEIAERALGMARQIQDPGWEVNILLWMGSAFGMDSLDRSLQYLEAALPISQKLGDKGIELSLLSAIGAQSERTGDYYRLLKDYEEKRLRISREIGNHLSEGNALMFCAQIQGIYLGDYESGLEMSRQAARLWEPILGRLFPLLRIAQIQIVLGNFIEAREILEQTKPLSEKTVDFIGRAGMLLIQAILYNTIGGEDNLRSVPGLVEEIRGMVNQKLVSRQYLMAACCEETLTYLRLATLVTNEEERQEIYQKALQASNEALSIYDGFGFVQIIECVSEEILFRHSMALRSNNQQEEADQFLQKAYDEMMRKHDLIPPESHYRRTYLQNISLHKNIMATYEGRFQKTK